MAAGSVDGGQTVGVLILALGILAVGALLVADRPAPLRRVRLVTFPVVVIAGCVASLALLIVFLSQGRGRLATSAGVVCLLFAVAASRRAAAAAARRGRAIGQLRTGRVRLRRRRRR